MMGWAPESGHQTLGTCIFSYDGRLHVGFKVDTRTITDPERPVAAFDAELVALSRSHGNRDRRPQSGAEPNAPECRCKVAATPA